MMIIEDYRAYLPTYIWLKNCNKAIQIDFEKVTNVVVLFAIIYPR